MNNAYNIKLLQVAGYDVDTALLSMGSIDAYNEILEDFYAENLDRVKKIIAYKKEMNLYNYAIEVHALKSECMYLGINVLAKKCEEQQLKSEANDINYIQTHFDEFMTEVVRVMAVVKKYLGK